MRVLRFFCVRAILLVLIASLVILSNLSAQTVPDRYIVVFKEDVANPHAAAASIGRANGLAVGHVYSTALKGFSAGIPAQALQGVKRNPNVAYIEPDLVVHAVDQTLPTGVNRIEVDENATASIDGIDDKRVDVDIAIIDTGIDPTHPDLNVAGGRRFYSVPIFPPFWYEQYEDDNYTDDNGHGTHVGGIAAAIDNDLGVVGVAPGARLWAVKVLDSTGSGYLSDVVAGIDWVTINAGQIGVANMSLSWQGRSSAARTAIGNSVASGVFYAVAAGNDGKDVYGPDGIFGTSDDFEPASYPEVATIAAMTDTDGEPGGVGPLSSYSEQDRNGDGVDDGVDDSFAFFSNYSRSVVSGNPMVSPGAAIDLLLPGVNIYSTVTPEGDPDIADPSGYNSISGTSMSSPHGAGLAALYIAANGRALDATGVYAIRQALINNGVQQTESRGLFVQNDPDVNEERIGWAGDSGTGSPPTVAWVYPDDGMEVEGSVTIQIGASDDDAPGTGVEWQMDGGTRQPAIYNSVTGYYEASWDSTLVADGGHTLYARATDSDSNVVTDSIVVITENVDDPPSVSWVNPKSNDTVAGTVLIQISTSDDRDSAGDLAVEWQVDGGTWESATYSSVTGYYEANWESTAVSDGSHTMGARAADSGNNVSSSNIIVTVSNNPSGGPYVWEIIWSKAARRKSNDLKVAVHVKEDLNGVAEVGDIDANGVPVTLWLIHDSNKNGTFLDDEVIIFSRGTTDDYGKVTYTLRKAPKGDYEAIVIISGANTSLDQDNPDWYFGFPEDGGDPTATALSSAAQLEQNYPNPPNPDTWIPFKLSEPGSVVIRIYNATGQLVRTVDLGMKSPGSYMSKGKAAYWDGRTESGEKVTSGIYFYVMEAGSFRAMRKMVILK